MRYQAFEIGQENMVSELVWEVFREFEAPDYAAQGVETFKAFIEPERLAEQIKNKGFKAYCCFDANELVGILALRDISHISLLFVKKSHHRNGIAKELLAGAVKELLHENPGLDKITVNSSPYAVEIYKKLGFKATDTMQEKNGIKYTPMSKYLF